MPAAYIRHYVIIGAGMKTIVTNGCIEVTAPPGTVLPFASDPALLAGWNNEYTGCIPEPPGDQEWTASFTCTALHGGPATWKLLLMEEEDGRATHIHARIEEEIGLRYPLRRWRVLTRRQRTRTLAQSLARMKGIAESATHHGDNGLKPADILALLNVYTSQFGSFTTLLWLVPAIGLIAQAFLMTTVLDGTGPDAARWAAAAISIVIAFASIQLMHDQRARAINHAELAKRASYRLSLTGLLGGSFGLDDAVPKKGADAQNVWATNRAIYAIWCVCMYLFVVVDALVIYSLVSGNTWFL